MSELMCLQISTLGERLVALSAIEWLLSTVGSHMPRQDSTLGERLVALSAIEKPLSGVDSHVLHQTLGCTQ